MTALQEANSNTKALETEDYFDDFAAAIPRCNALVGSSAQIVHERPVALSEHAERFLKTSVSYLRNEPQ